MLVGPMPPTKGGMTTFMLNLMASPLNEEFEFVPYTVSRPPKKDVIANYGYGAILRDGISDPLPRSSAVYVRACAYSPCFQLEISDAAVTVGNMA
jgi:hypothetical protein